jgi:gamma-glutamyltranspeptidase / glutathione hydrolase
VRPGKRMLSAMTPTIVLDPRGGVLLVTGTPGGSTIITTVAQIVSNVVDFRMDVATATAAPRLHHQHLPDTLRFEHRGLAPATVERLRAMGHTPWRSARLPGRRAVHPGPPRRLPVGRRRPRRGGAAVGLGEVRRVVQ